MVYAHESNSHLFRKSLCEHLVAVSSVKDPTNFAGLVRWHSLMRARDGVGYYMQTKNIIVAS